MPTKQRTIQNTKAGSERVEYWIVDDDGFIKTCSPTAWHHVDLPDTTTPSTMERVAQIRYTKVVTQFRDRVDDNQKLRESGMSGSATAYQWLCTHRKITF